jgi:hypothetical protein
MFDINATINTAIAQAVEAHMTGIQQIYANRMGEMADRISQLDSDLSTERANLQMALHRISVLEERKATEAPTEVKLSGMTDVPTGMDYNQKDALVAAFIDKLNMQEWFWDKVSHYVNEHIERVYGEPVTTYQVKEIVKELWTDIYETEVQDIAQRAIEDHDFDDNIRHTLREYDFTSDVEAVLEDYDMSSRIEEAIDDYDLTDKVTVVVEEVLEDKLSEAVDGIDIEDKVRSVLNKAHISINV